MLSLNNQELDFDLNVYLDDLMAFDVGSEPYAKVETLESILAKIEEGEGYV